MNEFTKQRQELIDFMFSHEVTDFGCLAKQANEAGMIPWKRHFFRMQYLMRFCRGQYLREVFGDRNVKRWLMANCIYVPLFGGDFGLPRIERWHLTVTIQVDEPGLARLSKNRSWVALAINQRIEEDELREIFNNPGVKKGPDPLILATGCVILLNDSRQEFLQCWTGDREFEEREMT